MYVYISTCIKLYICIYTYIHMYIYIHIKIYKLMQMYASLCICVYTHIHTFIHICIWTHILDALAKLEWSLYFVVKVDSFRFISKSFVLGLSSEFKAIQLGRLRGASGEVESPCFVHKIVYGFRAQIVYGFRPQLCTDSVPRISKT